MKNVVYTRKIIFKGEVIDGMHEAIIEPEVFESVQKLQRQRAKSNEKNFGETKKLPKIGENQIPRDNQIRTFDSENFGYQKMLRGIVSNANFGRPIIFLRLI